MYLKLTKNTFRILSREFGKLWASITACNYKYWLDNRSHQQGHRTQNSHPQSSFFCPTNNLKISEVFQIHLENAAKIS